MLTPAQVDARLWKLSEEITRMEQFVRAHETPETDALAAECIKLIMESDMVAYMELVTDSKYGVALEVRNNRNTIKAYRATLDAHGSLFIADPGTKFREFTVSPAGFHPDDGVFLKRTDADHSV